MGIKHDLIFQGHGDIVIFYYYNAWRLEEDFQRKILID